jgi:hypothetical protein
MLLNFLLQSTYLDDTFLVGHALLHHGYPSLRRVRNHDLRMSVGPKELGLPFAHSSPRDSTACDDAALRHAVCALLRAYGARSTCLALRQ